MLFEKLIEVIITAWNGNRPGARLRPPEYGSLRRIPLGKRYYN